jgi:flagellar hook-associated protein 2
MTSPSSFNVSGLLGANSIDTTTLINQLMQAAAIPQTQLKNQLSVQQSIIYAFQQINTKTTALQTAAQALTDPTSWAATAATSSNAAVVATSSATASAGTTTFDVLQLARGQVTTVAADSAGNVVADPVAGVTIGSHTLTNLASGSAADVAAAINAAQLGVRATVVQTDTGTVLQLASTSTGLASGFTTGGFQAPPQDIVAAQDAKVGVGDPTAGGYTVSSSTNTFTTVIPGVTFSVGALASNVTVTVAPDTKSISDKVQALVSAANVALGEISMDAGKGGILQTDYAAHSLATDIMSAVSRGTASGQSLKGFGIDMDKNGVLSFDATVFAQEYAADPAGTRTAISGSFAANLAATASNALAPVTGTITASIASAKGVTDNLNKQIDAWTTRLSDTQARLQIKYANMNTMLAKLQSQSTYLTSMLKSMNSNSSSSSNSS